MFSRRIPMYDAQVFFRGPAGVAYLRSYADVNRIHAHSASCTRSVWEVQLCSESEISFFHLKLVMTSSALCLEDKDADACPHPAVIRGALCSKQALGGQWSLI